MLKNIIISNVFLLLINLPILSNAQIVNLTPQNIQLILKLHNDERILCAKKPLIWNDVLVQNAEIWATKLINDCPDEETNCLVHQIDNKYGENLSIMVNFNETEFDIDSELNIGISEWLNEKPFYDGSAISKSGRPNGKVVGHYTQLIWGNTTQIGCAIARKKITRKHPYYKKQIIDNYIYILVCEYNPPGNYIGQIP